MENRRFARFALELVPIFFLLISQIAECRPEPPYVLFSESDAKLKNRASSPPYITGDGFRAACDYILDESNPELSIDQIEDLSTIFVGTHFLEVFFQTVHGEIKGRYILVTHNSDEAVPGNFAKYLDDEKMIAWFGQNVEGTLHPKLFPIPIGLENRYCPNGEDFSLLAAMREQYKSAERSNLLYMNFTPRYRSDRDHVFQIFMNAHFCKISSFIPYVEYLKDLGTSKFVLSPRGNGLDCLRTWESLYMGAIPVVKKTVCDEMYADLPVLLVDSWEEISVDFLQKSLDLMSQKNYDFSKLNISHWIELINLAKETSRAPLKRTVF